MAGVRLYGAWRDFEQAMDPDRFEQELTKHLRVAMRRIGTRFQRDARRAIRADAYAPNSPITVILKGSSKPLVDRGTLYQSLTFDVAPDARTMRMGIMRATAGPDAVNVGLVLHEGATIDVRRHPKVRVKVWAMVREALQRFGELSSRRRGAVRRAAGVIGTSSSRGGLWVIPGRPFIAEPLQAGAFQDFARHELQQAVKRALLT